MKKFIEIGSKLIIICTVLMIISAFIYAYYIDYHGYAYISMNNDRGISNKCYANKKGLFCNSKRKVIEVKQYGKR